MTKVPSTKRRYDLEERTAKFGELVTQLIKAATSVGANYCEADDAESKKDFKHKIGICKKESRESKHFIRMMAVAVPKLKEEAREHWQEAKELNLIFNSIYKKVK